MKLKFGNLIFIIYTQRDLEIVDNTDREFGHQFGPHEVSMCHQKISIQRVSLYFIIFILFKIIFVIILFIYAIATSSCETHAMKQGCKTIVEAAKFQPK